jgi:carbamoyl-phosphate synthase small subunit
MGEKLQITKRSSRSARSERGDFFKSKGGVLTLADGTKFAGQMPAWQKGIYPGEVVFNTGMTGYVESVTDPSYAGQILVFTYPLIGNYGVAAASGESDKIQVSGVIVSEAALHWSHSGATESLLEWLRSQNVSILMNVDTRALTKHLRIKGSMNGAIGSKAVLAKNIRADKKFVTIIEPIIYNETASKTVILVDCGAKDNILRSLLALDLRVKRVPSSYDYSNEKFDGVLLSNGPGDPTDYKATVKIARKALAKGKPVFGICLGTQIMALAAGAKTYKLKFGHRGHNQPCMENQDKQCFITSQNHGYAINEKTLPTGWRVYFRNLNDNSVEGIEHKTKPFFSVQFHPEASPGPTDTNWLFERFHKAL